MSSVNKTKIGYFSLDIERTGHGYVDDHTVAIGWSYSDATLDVIHKGNVCLDLQFEQTDKITDVDHMKLVWTERNYEMRCFDEFWHKNLNILALLQDKSKVNLVSDEYSMALALNNALYEAEKLFPTLNIITDTTLFDTTWCNILLMKHGFKGLTWTRPFTDENGREHESKFRWGYELDSYMLGSLGFSPEDNWSTFDTAKQKYIDALFPDIVINHDHHPENDAHSILVKFVRTVNYNSNK